MSNKQCDPNLFIIFGGSGDLARRKLLPALCRLNSEGHLHPDGHVLAVGRSRELTDESYRKLAYEHLQKAELAEEKIRKFDLGRLHFQCIADSSIEAFGTLRHRIEQLEQTHALAAENRAFYLALPPKAFAPTIRNLGNIGLNRSNGWTRLVVEKPFGHDLQSAQKLNQTVHEHFTENQIYRIDHYLGKETVQNLLVFRFANAILESLWNRERVHSVQITVAESLGVGTRAGYYDTSGAMRDMVQNHLTQLLTLVAMEVPSSFHADAIRYEKIKVLKSIAPLSAANVVFGQYGSGELSGKQVVGYLEEDGVPDSSTTETFVALKVEIDNWRWQGVPFFLRTGKRLPLRRTEIAIRFRQPPVCLFESLGSCVINADALIITLQPNEGFSMILDVKKPGEPFGLKQIPLSFDYSEVFEEIPEAYQTLVHDVLTGDQTLFVHSEEVEESWRLYQPLMDKAHRVYRYAAGSWGPQEASSLALPENELWQRHPWQS